MPSAWLLAGILWVGFALRLALLDRFAFHPDEAIYSYWALYGRQVDPFFLQVWPDKPPLYLWLLGWVLEGLGATAVNARLPNVAASVLSIAVCAALARRWWGERAALLAALLLALNPLAISFAPTAFTDPLMVLAGLLALCLAASRRWLWAGIWLGSAVMTKQQGVLFAPWVVAALFWPAESRPRTLSALAALLAGLLLVVAPIVCWDSLRWAVAPSPWDLGARHASGLALAAPESWLPRLLSWAQLSATALGPPWPWGLLLGAVGWQALRRERLEAGIGGRRTAPASQPAWALALWGLGFLALHLLSTAQIWDRYLLPLAPAVALLGAFGAVWVLAPEGRLSARQGALPATVLALWLGLLAMPASRAALGQLALGGDRGAFTGIEEISGWLAERTDGRPVLYHRTVGWHFNFHLFAPVQAGTLELRWYPSSVHLADNAAKSPHRPRYLVEADWSPDRDLAVQLAQRRLQALPLLRAGRFILYAIGEKEIHPQPWRLCARPTGLPTGWALFARGNVEPASSPVRGSP
jgi:4-amino-4-deoxy-L-arabinose transferase-like glycosyltransferase